MALRTSRFATPSLRSGVAIPMRCRRSNSPGSLFMNVVMSMTEALVAAVYLRSKMTPCSIARLFFG
ncbi:Uncharacterised protein [Mycobacteroides abscessus subsp. abscessus]|nr:Uncharacterised protein [Mycobacteroides abscessus subsp. abscessus]